MLPRMSKRRILSLWFPRLGAERLIRLDPGLLGGPVAVIRDQGNMQVLSSLSAEAEAEGLRPGQPLRDALAMCPNLLTRLSNPQAEAAFLTILRRWAGKYSPWVSEELPASLAIDLTGCAHLFGGEETIIGTIENDCADLGLTVHAGIGDTVGAAWALARYANQPLQPSRTGDAIDQEAPATRARAVKRRNWERGGPPPRLTQPGSRTSRIGVPGQTRTTLSPLPLAALRLTDDAITNLNRLGLRRVGDLIGTPRASLARRFGKDVVRRLDQALGVEPEPISPARPPVQFTVRLTLPDPIGLESDIMAGIDRLLPPLAEKLTKKGRGARRIRMQFFRSDQTMQWFDIGLARPSANPDRIRPLLVMKLGDVDAGFGIDTLRIDAFVTEPLHNHQHRGHLDAANQASTQLGADTALDDLIGKVGARIGLDAVTRRHPGNSHIPEKSSLTLAAAWSDPTGDWPAPSTPRPLMLWQPEPVTAPETHDLPLSFRWRRRDLTVVQALGPERISPEWWLDDPDWRSGVRDYWQVTVKGGERLWLYFAHGNTMSAGWFCHGAFA